ISLSPHPAPTVIYTLSLHDALPISADVPAARARVRAPDHGARRVLAGHHRLHPGHEEPPPGSRRVQAHLPPRCAARLREGLQRRSEEHTSELQSRENLVCRLLLEKK